MLTGKEKAAVSKPFETLSQTTVTIKAWPREIEVIRGPGDDGENRLRLSDRAKEQHIDPTFAHIIQR